MSFNYTTTIEGPLIEIHLNGKMIEEEGSTSLLNDVSEIVNEKCNLILLNLTELSYINSTGINVLINLLTKARNAGGELAIYNVSESIKKLLIISKLNTIFNSFETKQEAVDSLLKNSEAWQ